MPAQTKLTINGRPTLLWRVLVIGFLIVNIALAVHYIGSEYQAYFHTDAAVKSLLAREIYKAHDYFPKDWNYVNGDLWVLFGQTYIVPLLPFFKNNFRLHAFSGIVSAFLIFFGTYLVAKLATKSIWLALLSVAIVASGISGLLAENFYGQVSYGYVYYFSCFIFYCSWKFVAADRSENLIGARQLWALAIFALFFFAFLGNPQRAAPSYALPVIGASFAAILTRRRNINAPIETASCIFLEKRFFSLIGIIALSAGLGSLYHFQVLGRVNDVRGVAHAVWLSYPKMAANFVHVISQILSVFGALPQAGEIVFDGSGAYDALRLFAGLALIALIPFAIFRGIRDLDPGTAFFSTCVALVVAVFIFLQITTSVPEMSDPIQSARYLIPALILGLVVLISQTLRFEQPVVRIVSMLVIALLVTSGYRALLGSGISNSVDYHFSKQARAGRISLINFLKKNNLQYGYATYWNSGTYSVLSGEAVRVRQIVLKNGIPLPMRHLSSNAWYRPDAWDGQTFILMTDQESAQLDLRELGRYDLKPVKRLEFQTSKAITSPSANSTDAEPNAAPAVEKWVIYVFDQNIANKLPTWDLTYGIPSKFPVSPTTPHQIGTYVETSTGGVLEADPAEKGVLVFGPYARAPAGQYKVEFDLEIAGTANSTKSPVSVDVASNKGQITIASGKPASEGVLKYELPFSIQSQTEDLEFRVFTDGGVNVKVNSVTLSKIPSDGQAEKK